MSLENQATPQGRIANGAQYSNEDITSVLNKLDPTTEHSRIVAHPLSKNDTATTLVNLFSIFGKMKS